MVTSVRIAVTATVAIVAGLSLSQPPSAQVPGVPNTQVSPVDGKALYMTFCASCHGRTGHADGPAAPQHTPPVPDLTLIAQRDGKFDSTHVQQHIVEGRGQGGVMPNWKYVLKSRVGGDPARAHLAVCNLARYIQSMQVTNSQ